MKNKFILFLPGYLKAQYPVDPTPLLNPLDSPPVPEASEVCKSEKSEDP